MNFFFINYGLINYGNFNEGFLEHKKPNPIEYVYFKNAEKYAEEKEFRISLSCLGVEKYQFSDGTEFTFPESIMLSFNFIEAIRQNILKQIIINDTSNNKEAILSDLKLLFEKEGITLSII